MKNIESLFATIADSDPWGKVVSPLWAALLKLVEEPWSYRGPVSLPPSILIPAQLNSWRAHLVEYGSDKQQYCYDSLISLE